MKVYVFRSEQRTLVLELLPGPQDDPCGWIWKIISHVGHGWPNQADPETESEKLSYHKKRDIQLISRAPLVFTDTFRFCSFITVSTAVLVFFTFFLWPINKLLPSVKRKKKASKPVGRLDPITIITSRKFKYVKFPAIDYFLLEISNVWSESRVAAI